MTIKQFGIRQFGGVTDASTILYQGAVLSDSIVQIENEIPTVISSSATFYIDQDSGNDSADGSQLAPWKTIAGAIANLKANYVVNAIVTLKLLSAYNLSGINDIDLDEFRGNSVVIFDLNGFNIDFNSGFLFFSNCNSLQAFLFVNTQGTGELISTGGGGSLQFRECLTPVTVYSLVSDVDIFFNNCRRPTFTGFRYPVVFIPVPILMRLDAEIRISVCDNPTLNRVNLQDDAKILVQDNDNANVSDIRIQGTGTEQGSSYLVFKNVRQLNYTGYYAIAATTLRRRLLEVIDCVGGKVTFDQITNETGGQVPLDIPVNNYAFEVINSSIDYEDRSTVGQFIEGSAGRAFKIDATSVITYDVGDRSPEELPIRISAGDSGIINSIDSQSTINNRNYRSNVGLLSLNTSLAIDELASISFLTQANRLVSGILPASPVGASQVDFQPGICYFFDKSDRSSPQFLKVSLTGSPSVDLTGIFADPQILDDGVAYCYVDNTGLLIATVEPPTSKQLEDKIYLAKITYVSDAITAVESFVVENDAVTKDLLSNDGVKNIDIQIIPAVFNPVVENFQLQLLGGDMLLLGSNFDNDPNNPHTLAIASIQGDNIATDFLTWDEYLPNGVLVEGNANTLNFGRFSNNGVLVTFGGNDASVKHFYIDKDSNVTAIIGVVRYGSQNLATERATIRDSAPQFPDRVHIATLVGAANGTDNSDVNDLIILNV